MNEKLKRWSSWFLSFLLIFSMLLGDSGILAKAAENIPEIPKVYKEVTLTDEDFDVTEDKTAVSLNDTGKAELSELQASPDLKRLIIEGREIKTLYNGLFKDTVFDSLYIRGSIENTGDETFKNTGISDLYMENVKNLGKESFAYNRLNVFQAERLETIGEGAFKNNLIENFTTGAKTIYKYAFDGNPLKELILKNPEVILDTEIFTKNSGVKVTGENLNFVSSDKNTYLVNPLNIRINLKDVNGNPLKTIEMIKEKMELPFDYTPEEIEGYIKPFNVIKIDSENTDIVYNIKEEETSSEIITETENIIQTETEIETETIPQTEAQTETASEIQIETGTVTVPETVSETISQTETETKTEIISQTEIQTGTEFMPQTEKEITSEYITEFPVVSENEMSSFIPEMTSETETELQTETSDEMTSAIETQTVNETTINDNLSENNSVMEIMTEAETSSEEETSTEEKLPAKIFRDLVMAPMAASPANITFTLTNTSGTAPYNVKYSYLTASSRFIISGNETVPSDYKIVFTMPDHIKNTTLSAPLVPPGVTVSINRSSKPYTVTYDIKQVKGGADFELKVSAVYNIMETPKGYPGYIKADLYDSAGVKLKTTLQAGPYTPDYVMPDTLVTDIMQPFYSGEADPSWKYIKAGTERDYTYTYSLLKSIPTGVASNAFQRTPKTYVYTAELPLYDKYDAGTNGFIKARAKFDPAKNPGWVLSSDGTKVTKTVNIPMESPFDTEEAAQAYWKKVNEKVIFSYPMAKEGAVFQNNLYLDILIDKPEYNDKTVSLSSSETTVISGLPKGDLFYKQPAMFPVSETYFNNNVSLDSAYMDFTFTNSFQAGEEPRAMYDRVVLKNDPVIAWYLSSVIKPDSAFTTDSVTFTEEGLDPSLMPSLIANYGMNMRRDPLIDSLTFTYSYTVSGRRVSGTLKQGEQHVIPKADRPNVKNLEVTLKGFGSSHYNNSYGAVIGTELRDKTILNSPMPSTVVKNNTGGFSYTIRDNRTAALTAFPGTYKAHVEIRDYNFKALIGPGPAVVTDGSRAFYTYMKHIIRPDAVWGDWNPEGIIGKNADITYIIPAEITFDADNIIKPSGDSPYKPEEMNITVERLSDGRSAVRVRWKDPNKRITVGDLASVYFRDNTFKMNPTAFEGKYYIEAYLTVDTEGHGIDYTNPKVNPLTGRMGASSMTEITYQKNKAFGLYKEIAEEGKPFTQNIRTSPGGKFEYKITIDNPFTTTASNVSFIDIFPYKDDYDLVQNGTPARLKRGSYFSNEFLGVKSVKVISKTGTTDITKTFPLKYVKSISGIPTNATGNLASWVDSNMSSFSSSPAGSLGIYGGGTGFNLQPETKVEIILSMKAPFKENMTTEEAFQASAIRLNDAVNTAAYRYSGTSGNFVEGNKVVNKFVMAEKPSDQKFARIVIYKRNRKTNIILKGATFTLYQNGQPVVSRTSILTTTDFAFVTPGTYEVRETAAPDGYILDPTPWKVTVTDVDAVYEHTFYNDPDVGKITVIKRDSATGAPLKGAVMSISKGTWDIESKTTDAEGKVTFEDLYDGIYTIKEKSAPAGYKLSGEIKNIELKKGAMEVSFDYFNDPLTGSITVVKKEAATGKLLSGAVMSLMQNGKEIMTAASGSDGKAIFSNVPYGDYIVKEKTAPSGYVLSTEQKAVTIGPSSVNVSFDYLNTPATGDIRIRKYDVITNEVLPGAEFVLMQNGTVKYTAVSNASGYIIFTGITPGVYTLKETKAPAGYRLRAGTLDLDIKSGHNTEASVSNQKDIRLNVYKKDSSGNLITLPAEFTLKNVSTGEEKTYKTDKGMFMAELFENDYILTETKAPEGYRLNNRPFTLKVNKGTIKLSDDKNHYYINADVTDYKTTQELPGTGTFGVIIPVFLSGIFLIFIIMTEIRKRRTLTR